MSSFVDVAIFIFMPIENIGQTLDSSLVRVVRFSRKHIENKVFEKDEEMARQDCGEHAEA